MLTVSMQRMVLAAISSGFVTTTANAHDGFGICDDGQLESGWYVSIPAGPSDYFNNKFTSDHCHLVTGMSIAVLDFGNAPPFPSAGVYYFNSAVDPTCNTPDLSRPIATIAPFTFPPGTFATTANKYVTHLFAQPVMVPAGTAVHACVQFPPDDPGRLLIGGDSDDPGAGCSFFTTDGYASPAIGLDVNFGIRLTVDEPTEGRITGRRVLLGHRGIPMTGVTMYFVGDSGTFSTTTCYGLYEIPSMPEGDYKVYASLAFSEPSSGVYSTIVNYPNNQPKKRYRLGGPSPQVIPNIIFPDPVILQAGWNGGLSTFESCKTILEQDPAIASSYVNKPAFLCFRMPNEDEQGGGYINGGIRLGYHAENASRLSIWIKNSVRYVLRSFIEAKDLDAVSYSVVAHSMGGIITRAMVTSSTSPPIYRIVGLDCPHGGSRNLYGLPNCYNMREYVLNGKRKDDDYTDLGWTARGWNEAYIDYVNKWLSYSCVEGGWVKPDESAWGRGQAKRDRAQRQDSRPPHVSSWAAGCEVTIDWLGHQDIHEDHAILGQVAQFLWSGVKHCNVTGSSGPQSEPDDLGGISGESTAQAGGTASRVVFFDQNNEVYAQLMVMGAGAVYTLWDQDGSQIIPSNTLTEQISDDSFMDLITISPAPTGMVTIVLAAGASASATLGFAMQFGNGRWLHAATDPGFIVAGAPVQILADVEDVSEVVLVGSNATISARIVLPDGSERPLSLFDDGAHGDGGAGDGVFGNVFTGTTTEGRYEASCHAVFTLGTDVVERSDVGSFAVAPTGASFAGASSESTPDDDHDGLFDSLVLTQPVSFAANGSFRLLGTLTDSTGATISNPSVDYDNDQGVTTATLSLLVPGAEIVRHAVSGKWTLSGLTLYEKESGLASAVSSDFVTQLYDYHAFDGPIAPTVSWISPSEGRFHGGNEIVVGGSGLLDVTNVLVGARVAAFQMTDGFSLVVTVPGAVETAGQLKAFVGQGRRVDVDVRITTSWGTTVLTGAYTYTDG